MAPITTWQKGQQPLQEASLLGFLGRLQLDLQLLGLTWRVHRTSSPGCLEFVKSLGQGLRPVSNRTGSFGSQLPPSASAISHPDMFTAFCTSQHRCHVSQKHHLNWHCTWRNSLHTILWKGCRIIHWFVLIEDQRISGQTSIDPSCF